MGRKERIAHWLFTFLVLLLAPGLYSLSVANAFDTPYAVAYLKLTGGTMSGTLNMNANIITNIGNASTDFDTSGGLTANSTIQGAGTNAPALLNTAGSSTVPNITPNKALTNYGISCTGTTCYIIANGAPTAQFDSTALFAVTTFDSRGANFNGGANNSGYFYVNDNFAAAGQARDVTNGSCVAGEIAVDTATTVELCGCSATNTWRCIPTTTTNPAD